MSTRSFVLKIREDVFALEALITVVGDDLHIIVWGGDKPHIGAIALAQPRKSLENPENNSATVSVLCILGHKEDSVVKYMSEKLAAELNRTIVVTAGMHWDVFEITDTEKVMKNVTKLAEMIKDHFTI